MSNDRILEEPVLEKEYALLEKGIISKLNNEQLEVTYLSLSNNPSLLVENGDVTIMISSGRVNGKEIKGILYKDNDNKVIMHYSSLSDYTDKLIELSRYLFKSTPFTIEEDIWVESKTTKKVEPVVFEEVKEEQKVEKVAKPVKDKQFNLDDEKFSLPTKNTANLSPKVSSAAVNETSAPRPSNFTTKLEPASLPEVESKKKAPPSDDKTYSYEELKRYIDLACVSLDMVPKLPFSIYNHLKVVSNLAKSGPITDKMKEILVENLYKIASKEK